MTDDTVDMFNKQWALSIIEDIDKYPPGIKYKEVRSLAWITLKRISEDNREIKSEFFFA